MKEPEYSAMSPAVAAAIAEMRAEQGDKFSLDKINLAELERRTGISRAKLRHLKANGFVEKTHASKCRKASSTLLSGYTGILDSLLKNGVVNSAVCLAKLRENGFLGGQTIVKSISPHTSTSSPPSVIWWPRRATVAVGTALSREKLFKWTGALQKCRLTMEVSTMQPASP